MRNTIALLVVVCWSCSAWSTAGEITPEEFFRQYEPAAAKLAEYYQAMQMSGRLTTWHPETRLGPAYANEEDFKLYARGAQLRVDMFRQLKEDTTGTAMTGVVAKPEDSFAVTREVGSKEYALRAFAPYKRDVASSLYMRHYPVFAPLRDRGGFSFLDRLHANNLTITSIVEETRDGENLVTLTFRQPYKLQDNPPEDHVGIYTFSKDKHWALVASDLGPVSGPDRHIKALVEYDTGKDGMPLLKRATYTSFRDGELRPMARAEITSIEPGPVPEREFTLAAFQLPEMTQPERTNWFLWLNLLVILGIVLALLVRWFSTRRGLARGN